MSTPIKKLNVTNKYSTSFVGSGTFEKKKLISHLFDTLPIMLFDDEKWKFSFHCSIVAHGNSTEYNVFSTYFANGCQRQRRPVKAVNVLIGEIRIGCQVECPFIDREACWRANGQRHVEGCRCLSSSQLTYQIAHIKVEAAIPSFWRTGCEPKLLI